MSAEELLTILSEAASTVGADNATIVECAEAFEGIGRGTLTLAARGSALRRRCCDALMVHSET